ncbi:alpha-amylase family glycosyl hydrolase [Nonlabens ponticola]|uniref:Alpha-amlyase n=1 Tax=Nonlabens ponticola TaxID=2496866 RepID=A0A3S9MWL1_9FLAO|nr:alpha-amylase family glycosyl hydrolase [Nonlabens ponticola]AZQ43532.1 alpha-amlyase [Nonlabens ponticola]
MKIISFFSWRYIPALGLLILLSACSDDQTKPSKASIIQGQTLPVYANNAGVQIDVRDFLVETSQLDSITATHGLVIEKRSEFLYGVLFGSNDPFVNLVTLWTDGVRNDIPFIKKDEMTASLIYDGDAENVQIKGEFTNWSLQDLKEEDGERYYLATIPKGNFQYLFVENGVEEQLDPNDLDVVSNGMGGYNRLLRNTPSKKAPRLSLGQITEDGFTFKANEKLDQLYVLYANQKIEVQQDSLSYKVDLPKVDFTNRNNKTQLVRVYGGNLSGIANDLLIPVQDGKVVTDPDQLSRTDHHAQVLYFMMVDRFLDGDPSNSSKVDDPEVLPQANYMGGDLAGVLQKINDGYFEELGINTIWLSPITQNPEGAYGLWPEPRTKFSGYHGYWPVSNTKIDDRFGDRQLMQNIIAAAHERDINVILDYVANHVHEEHPVYQNNPDWATDLYLPDGSLNTERWDDHRLTTWFDTFMPTLDFSKPEVVEKMTDSALYWMTEYDLDGFRHDATKHVPEVYWKTLTRKIRQNTDRPFYQIGETYGSYDLIRSYLSTGMLDAQFDFNMYDSGVSAFAKADKSYSNLTQTLAKGLDYYGHHHLMGNISGNQDRARFISYASGDVSFDEDAKAAGWTRDVMMSDSTAYDRLGMLHAFNMTIPGVPVIYYGDEYGSIGANDPDNRRMMKFDDLSERELKLKELTKQLVDLRRNSISLIYGTTEIVSESNGMLFLRRTYFDEVTMIFFNENPISFNVVKKPGDDVAVKTVNAIESKTHYQVPAKNFAMVQLKNKK